MTATHYKKLALDWQPDAANTKGFYRILGIVLFSALVLAIAITFIKVPPENKRQRAEVPDRVADFIARKEKPKPPPAPEKKLPPPPPKPVETPPVEKNEVVQEITKQRDQERKPLTESEIRARKVAEKSGLLALANELNDLIDTKDVSAGLSKNLSTNGNDVGDANVIAGHSTDSISAATAQSGGKVDAQSYAASVTKTEIDARNVGKDFTDHKEKAVAKAAAAKTQSGGSAEENVTIVFDKNKGTLYSLYERERRNTQGLQGKIILQLTISPAGDVVDVKIISSELNSPELESRILSRVKTFKFNINSTKDITVTYPIEFLPS
jgi:protein TonB